MGWVQRRRDHGGVIFLDLRDRSGLVQTVLSPDRQPEAFKTSQAVRPEYVVADARAGSAGVPREPPTRTCRPGRSRSW